MGFFSYRGPLQHFPLSARNNGAGLSGGRFGEAGARRLICHAAVIVATTDITHAGPFAAARAALLERRERGGERGGEGKKMQRTIGMLVITNLGPRTKAPLGFVALMGRDFGPLGDNLAGRTLGHFAVLRNNKRTW